MLLRFGSLIMLVALAATIAAVQTWDLWPRIAAALGIQYNTLIVLVGTSLLGACAGLIGSFAVLRRQALMGDALAHAALPGICLAFLWRGERDLPLLLAGALATGLLGVSTVTALRRWTRIKEDAAIGIVLSVYFGAGLALSRVIQSTTSTGSKAGLDSYILGKTAGMISADIVWIAGVSIASLLIVLLFYKEFKLASFDTGFASAQGWPAVVLDLSLMGLVAVTVVLGLPAVGVVMMAALLILPGAAARFWTDRLGLMLALSAALGMLVGMAGTLLSARYSGMPAGPIIVLVGAALFLASVLFAPRRGGIARWLATASLRRKVQQQKILAAIYQRTQSDRQQEFGLDDLLQNRAWKPAQLERLLARLIGKDLIQPLPNRRYRLTPAGIARAETVLRAHRIWRQFLEDHAELAGTLVDLDADALEEQISPPTIREMEARLQQKGQRAWEAAR